MWPLLAWALARFLVVRVDLPNAQTLVVLAGSSTYLERTHLAAELFKTGRARAVLLTNDATQGGWSNVEQRNPLFVERAIAELVAAGVPREVIEVMPHPVANTYDEARFLREYAVARKLSRLLVVTSAYHSRRALWTLQREFRGSGIELGLEPVAPGIQTPSAEFWWLHLRGWQSVPTEYAKLIYYRIHY